MNNEINCFDFNSFKNLKININSIKNVLKELSVDENKMLKPMNGKKYNAFKVFDKYPLICLNGKEFIPIDSIFLIIQLSSKFIMKTLLLARAKDKKPETNINTFIGKRLELYLKELCNLKNEIKHYDEYNFSKKEENLSSDRIIIETFENQKYITLIQLKSKTFNEDSIFGYSFESIENDLEKSYIDCIFKSLNFLYSLENLKNSNKLNDNYKVISEEILEAKNYCFIGITYDLIPIFLIDKVRKCLMEKVELKIKNKNEKFLCWYKNKFSNGILWHIMDLTEFQTFLSIEKKICFFNEISEYIIESNIDKIPLSKVNDSLPHTFRSYLINKHGNKNKSNEPKLELLSEIENVFFKFTNEVKACLNE